MRLALATAVDYLLVRTTAYHNIYLWQKARIGMNQLIDYLYLTLSPLFYQ